MTPETPETPSPGEQNVQRVLHLCLVGVIAIAFIGFFVGLDHGVPHADEGPVEPVANDRVDGVLPSMSYAEVRTARIGPNRDWAGRIHDLPGLTATGAVPVESPSADHKREALALRNARRAYNGAPPVIPHAAEQISDAACMSCHDQALQVGTRPADLPPHPYLANCQQCHVVAASSQFAPMVLADNSFVGVPAPFEGARAWLGAPPVVPHSTFMRDNCLSCHGPAGKFGLRTTHPERGSCLQCHAPSAALDHLAHTDTPAFLPPLDVDIP